MEYTQDSEQYQHQYQDHYDQEPAQNEAFHDFEDTSNPNQHYDQMHEQYPEDHHNTDYNQTYHEYPEHHEKENPVNPPSNDYNDTFQHTEQEYTEQNRYTECESTRPPNASAEAANSYYGTDATQPSDHVTIIPGCDTLMASTLDVYPSPSIAPHVPQLKFALILKPFAEIEIPQITDPADTFVAEARCRHCRAHLNPYCLTKKFTTTSAVLPAILCAFCHKSTEISVPFYNKIQRGEVDAMKYNVVEFPAGAYMDTEKLQPTYLFAININRNMIESGALTRIIATIKRLLNDEQSEEHGQYHNFNHNPLTNIAFLTYDSSLKFYNFQGDRERPKVYISPEVNNSFLPIRSESMFVNVATQKERILNFLDLLPTLHPLDGVDGVNEGSSLGTMLDSAYAILKKTGGKVVAFNFGLAYTGMGKLHDRLALDQKTISNINLMLKRQDHGNLYVDVAQAMVQASIGVDLHLFSSREQHYCDVASIHPVCSTTGGDIFHYHQYNDHNHGPSLENNLYFSLSRNSAWTPKVRLRTSLGMSYTKICGNMKMEGAGSVAASTCHADSTVTFQLAYNAPDDSHGHGNRMEYPRVNFQSAFLYTDNGGQRWMRICTRQFEVTPNYQKLFDGIQLPQLTALVAKRAAQRSLQSDLTAGRLVLAENAIHIAELYCALVHNGKPLDSHDNLPESLVDLPVDTLGMMRCSALVDVRDSHRWAHVDERFHALFSIMHLDAFHLQHYLRPTMYRVDQLLELDEQTLNDENWLPDILPLLKRYVFEESIYLLDNGDKFVFRMGSQVDPTITDTFFEWDESGVYPSHLKESEDNEYVAKLRLIMDYLTESKSHKYQSVEIIHAGTDKEGSCKFDKNYLIFDHSESCLSLTEFQELIRRRIMKKLRTSREIPRDWDSPKNANRANPAAF